MVDMNKSFGAPTGTVRAIITLLLIAITACFGWYVISLMTTDIDMEKLKLALVVFTTFNTLTSIMIGSYIVKK